MHGPSLLAQSVEALRSGMVATVQTHGIAADERHDEEFVAGSAPNNRAA